MGRATAEAYAETVTDDATRRRAVRAHLWSNLYPPLGEDWVQPAVDAIDAVSGEDPEEEVDLPSGVTVSAVHAVRVLRLDAFLYGEDFEDMDDDVNPDDYPEDFEDGEGIDTPSYAE
jgi:hypothetical protein